MNSFVGESYTGSLTDVDISTLDEQCALCKPVLIKIDVEGFEADDFKVASQVLATDSLLAVVVEGQTDEVNQIFENTCFVDVDYCPLSRSIKPHGRPSANRIWIKLSRYGVVEDSLRSAPRRSVYGNTFLNNLLDD